MQAKSEVNQAQVRHVEQVNFVRFTLPALPLSINAIYQIIYSERRVELKPEARRWKSEAKAHMPPWKPESGESFISIEVVFYYDFYFRNGKLRQIDTPNMEKLLIDAVAERYGFNDSRVKRHMLDSHHSAREAVVVTVSEYYESAIGGQVR